MTDATAALSTVLGTEISYFRAPLEMARKMVKYQGAPDWAAEHIGNIKSDIEAGTMSRDTGRVAELLGRPPRTLAEFMADHADAFRA